MRNIKNFMLTMLLALLCCLSSHAYDFEQDGIYYNKLSDGTSVEVTRNPDRYSGDVAIPTNVEYNGTKYTVTSIGYEAFKYNRSLTSIDIPGSVTLIGDYAFYCCSSLTYIYIPNSVTSIGYGAFLCCSNLTSVNIPNSVTYIGDYAFCTCPSLTSFTGELSSDDHRCVVLDGTLKAFAPGGLTSYSIPNSITRIGGYAFYGCSSLTSIEIPNSVTSIGDYAFYCCSNLTSVNIPNSVTYIGNSAFLGCDGLTSVCLPISVTHISGRMLEGCSNLSSVEIPNSVAGIGEYAFEGCSSLLSVEIPNTVTHIGQGAFSNCYSLTSVEIPNSVISIIGDDMFYGCSSLTSVKIPHTVTYIGDRVFYGCSSLTSIEIPNPVTSIGGYAFKECTSLMSVISYNPIPPTLRSNTFDKETKQECIVKVPLQSVDAYKADEYWGLFNNIVSIEGIETAVLGLESSKSGEIKLVNGQLVVSGTKKGERIQLVSVDGAELCSMLTLDGATTLPYRLAKGTKAVVKYGGKAVKIIF